MTQIEKLLAEGFITEEFLKEEVRCDYTISSSMKKVWAIELDLFREFDRVCKKHHLSYCAMGGTMLGAVRHLGFIPWDDDMDVMMMRDQYEKLCEIAPSEFKHPYFLQTQYSDFGATYGHAKLRNSETTCIFPSDMAYEKTMNQGIFFDIFPLDNVIDNNQKLFNKQKLEATILKTLADLFATSTKDAFRKHSTKAWLTNTRKFLMMLSEPLNYKLANFFWKKFDKACQRYNNIETEKVSTISFQFNKRWMHYRADYESTVEMPFEFLTIPVSANYNHALEVCYGDWHKMVRGGSEHEGIILDADHPYTEYFKKNR